MHPPTRVAVAVLLLAAACTSTSHQDPGAATSPSATPTQSASSSATPHATSASSGIPPLLNAHDVYAADRPGALTGPAKDALSRVYVPNSESNTVDVIDPKTYKVVDQFAVGALPTPGH